MSRPLRIEFPLAYYHVMNRGLAYQEVFTDQSDRERFLDLLGECHEMWGVQVIAYCLMGNHYHLLLQTLQGNLSRVMRHLDGLYTQRYNRLHKRDGPLFRGRYKAVVVDAEAYLLAVARYIHHNPVEAGLVRSPEAYRWSSCRAYLDPRKRPKWLDAAQLLRWFSKEEGRAELLAFMRSKVDEPVKSFYGARRWLTVLGSERFIEKIRGTLRKGQRDLREVPDAKPYIRPDFKRCLEVVGRVYGTKEDEILRSQRGRRNEARAMAMFLCRRVSGMKQEEIAKVFGVGGYSAVSSTVGRIQAELEEGGKMARRYTQIQALLHT